MLSKSNKKTLVATLVITILSLSVTSWIIITISAPNYASAQVSSQNATTTVGDGAAISNINATNTTISAEENRSISAVEGIGDAGEQSNITTPQKNETTDGNTTQGGTIGSGGAGGAGIAGGIMTGEDTRTHNSTS
ncbi:MAG TPA: hypothetical protein VJ643_02500 [Nitrososphaera sp.]|nr:hypothetical protein [Nitrososphaera sp.]